MPLNSRSRYAIPPPAIRYVTLKGLLEVDWYPEDWDVCPWLDLAALSVTDDQYHTWQETTKISSLSVSACWEVHYVVA